MSRKCYSYFFAFWVQLSLGEELIGPKIFGISHLKLKPVSIERKHQTLHLKQPLSNQRRQGCLQTRQRSLFISIDQYQYSSDQYQYSSVTVSDGNLHYIYYSDAGHPLVTSDLDQIIYNHYILQMTTILACSSSRTWSWQSRSFLFNFP